MAVSFTVEETGVPGEKHWLYILLRAVLTALYAPDYLNSNLTTELSSFAHIFNISLVHQTLQRLDSVMLSKVIVEDNIECAFPNVEISLRLFLTARI